MKNTKGLKVLSAATLTGSMLFSQAVPAFAQEVTYAPARVEANANTVPYQVKLDTHGGSMSVNTVESDETGLAVLPTEVPVKDGYTFLGWAEDPESGQVSHQPGDELTLTNDLKLYAVWQEDAPAVTYRVMLDTHGGSISVNTVESDETGLAVLPSEVPVKDGCTFLGWAEDPESGQVSYQPGDELTLTNDMKLYAVWQEDALAVTYRVMLDTHGGSMSVHSVESDENGVAVLPSEVPVKDGYTFLGWTDSPESTQVLYQPGDTLTITGDLKLYAVWQDNKVSTGVADKIKTFLISGALAFDAAAIIFALKKNDEEINK